MDFDLCGLGHYPLDLCTVRDSLKTHHAGRLGALWGAFLAGYERERPLPQDLRHHLETFEVMRKVSAVNRQLELLSRGNDPQKLRSPRFLANVASWLKDLSRNWAILPAGLSEKLGELSYFGAELAAVL